MTDQIDEALAKLTRMIKEEVDQVKQEGPKKKSMDGFGEGLAGLIQDEINTNPNPSLTRDEVEEVRQGIKDFVAVLKSREGKASEEDLLAGWKLVLTARAFVFSEQMKIVRVEAKEQTKVEESDIPEDSADELELEVRAIDREIDRRKTMNLSDRSTLLGLGYEFLTTQNQYIFYPLLALHRTRDELKLRIKRLRAPARPVLSEKEQLVARMGAMLDEKRTDAECIAILAKGGVSPNDAKDLLEQAKFEESKKKHQNL